MRKNCKKLIEIPNNSIYPDLDKNLNNSIEIMVFFGHIIVVLG